VSVGTGAILLTLTLRDNNDVVDQADLAMHARASEEHNGHHNWKKNPVPDCCNQDLALLGLALRS
jgi:hypothetical protein